MSHFQSGESVSDVLAWCWRPSNHMSANHTWASCESAPFKRSGVTNYSEYSSTDRYCTACSSSISEAIDWRGRISACFQTPSSLKLHHSHSPELWKEMSTSEKNSCWTVWRPKLPRGSWERWNKNCEFRWKSGLEDNTVCGMHARLLRGVWGRSLVYLKMGICSVSASFNPPRCGFGSIFSTKTENK